MPLARAPRILEIEDYKPLDLPPRSQLYHLAPIGLASPLCESFSSYISRLAAAHFLTTANLLRWVLSNMQEEMDETNRVVNIKHQMESLYLINGFGPITQSWVNRISALTLRDDICQTTLLRYEGLFSPLGLRRGNRAWCPLCLFDWQTDGKPIYEPLLWSLKPVSICPLHSIHLETSCPACSAPKLPLLGWRSVPGYCSRCSAWLGKEIPGAITTISDDERWATHAISELIAYLPGGPTLPISSPKEMIQSGVQQLCQGNIAQFGKIIGKSKTTIWTWLNEDFCLPFSEVMNLCRRLDLSPLDFMLGNKSCWAKAKQQEEPHVRRPKGRKGHAKDIDWPAVGNYLLTVKEGLVRPLPTLSQVAVHLGLTVTGLRAHYPELCRDIACNYKAELSRQAAAKLAQTETRIKDAMQELMKQGVDPVRRQVAEKLGERFLLRRNAEFTIWQRLYAELCNPADQ